MTKKAFRLEYFLSFNYPLSIKWWISATINLINRKDVRLPSNMQRAMATEAEAAREARAKVVAAEGEQKASIALKEAADTINKVNLVKKFLLLE